MKTMTTNSKELNSTLISIKPSDFQEDWDVLYRQTSLLGFEYHLFFDALHFLALNNVFFDRNTILDIKKAVMNDIDKKNVGNEIVNMQLRNGVVPMKLKDVLLKRIDSDIEEYVEYVENNVKNPKKMVIQEIDDLYYSCISLIRDASMNGKKNESPVSVDYFCDVFQDKVEDLKNLGCHLRNGGILQVMFQVIMMCKMCGGDFHMIDALYNKLGEYLESNYKD